LVLYAKSDGRLWFVIPAGKYSLVGTTDTDYKGDLEAVYAEKADVDYLMQEVQRVFRIWKRKIYIILMRLRSLPDSGDEKPGNVSRAHKTIDHEKWTRKRFCIGAGRENYRGTRYQRRNHRPGCKKLDIKTKCKTATTPLPGAPIVTREELSNMPQRQKLILKL